MLGIIRHNLKTQETIVKNWDSQANNDSMWSKYPHEVDSAFEEQSVWITVITQTYKRR